MRKFVLPTLIIMAISCRAPQSFVGHYQRDIEHLKLNKDSTFEYTKASDLSGVSATGTWFTIEKGKILLKSDYDYNRLPFTVTESRTAGNGTRIEIREEQPGAMSSWKGMIYSCFLVNGYKFTREYLGPLNTDSSFNAKTIDFEVRYKDSLLRTTTGFIRNKVGISKYNVHDPSANNFIISLPLKSHFLVSLDISDTVFVRGKKLIWPVKGKYPFYKVKVGD